MTPSRPKRCVWPARAAARRPRLSNWASAPSYSTVGSKRSSWPKWAVSRWRATRKCAPCGLAASGPSKSSTFQKKPWSSSASPGPGERLPAHRPAAGPRALCKLLLMSRQTRRVAYHVDSLNDPEVAIGHDYFLSTVNILNVPSIISGRKFSLVTGLNKAEGR